MLAAIGGRKLLRLGLRSERHQGDRGGCQPFCHLSPGFCADLRQRAHEGNFPNPRNRREKFPKWMSGSAECGARASAPSFRFR
jgi:hypothetical protein